MELKLQFENTFRLMTLDKVNVILGTNKSGKTSLLNKIGSLLSGEFKDKSLVNGISPTRDTFNVVKIESNRDIESEIELKSKSNFNKQTLKKFIIENEEEIDELAVKFVEEIQNLFYARTEYSYILSNSKINLTADKVKKFESILFTLQMDENTTSTKEEFFIWQCIENLEYHKHNFILIDDFDRYLDYDVINKLILTISKQYDNITFILTSNKKYCINELNINKIFLTDCKEIKILEQIKIIMFKEYLEKEQLNMSLDDYIVQNEELFIDEDFLKFYEKNKIKLINEINLEKNY